VRPDLPEARAEDLPEAWLGTRPDPPETRPMAPTPIVVRSLGKSYGRLQAVRDVSFTVERGEIFGLIGPDGGGKTTILRTVVSLLSFDAGEVLFEGKSVNRNPGYVRSNVGYMPQRFSLYQDLTVEENLRFFGGLFGVPRAELAGRLERLYEFSSLSEFKKRRAGALSGGMKQKLALSCMLVHAPEIIVLDEPTFGVDPVSRNDFWMILKSLAREGTTILVSTAYMDEALQCDRVGLVFRGRLLAADAPSRLRDRFAGPLFLAPTDTPHLAYRLLQSSSFCSRCTLFGEGVHFTLAAGATTGQVVRRLADGGVACSGVREIEPTLEDLFLQLMEGHSWASP
jgi:ABC-2 type transport system ATP-binding protein